jgi:hypothetical protein
VSVQQIKMGMFSVVVVFAVSALHAVSSKSHGDFVLKWTSLTKADQTVKEGSVQYTKGVELGDGDKIINVNDPVQYKGKEKKRILLPSLYCILLHCIVLRCVCTSWHCFS